MRIETEQTLAIIIKMVAIKETLAALGDNRMQPQLAVNQWQIPEVFAVSESEALFFIVRGCMFVPQNIKGVKKRLGATEQQVSELRLALNIEANDFAIQNAAATLQVTSQSFEE